MTPAATSDWPSLADTVPDRDRMGGHQARQWLDTLIGQDDWADMLLADDTPVVALLAMDDPHRHPATVTARTARAWATALTHRELVRSYIDRPAPHMGEVQGACYSRLTVGPGRGPADPGAWHLDVAIAPQVLRSLDPEQMAALALVTAVNNTPMTMVERPPVGVARGVEVEVCMRRLDPDARDVTPGVVVALQRAVIDQLADQALSSIPPGMSPWDVHRNGSGSHHPWPT